MPNTPAKAALHAGAEIPEPDVRALLREIADRDAESHRELARRWGISPAYLSDVLSGKRAPGPKVLRAMGLVRRRVVTVAYAAKPLGGEGVVGAAPAGGGEEGTP